MKYLKLYGERFLSSLRMVLSFVQAFFVLIGAILVRLCGDNIYTVSFFKVGRKWYCHVPCWPKLLFERTLMVGGAAKFIEQYAWNREYVPMIVEVCHKDPERYFSGAQLVKTQSTLVGGAFYKDPYGEFEEEIWLCPVTLFLLGGYPKRIFLHNVNGHAG